MLYKSTLIYKIKHLRNYAKFATMLYENNNYGNLINELEDVDYIYWNNERDLQNLSKVQILAFIIECSFSPKFIHFDSTKHSCFFDIIDFARMKNPQCKKYSEIFETLNINTNTVLINELKHLIREVSNESFESKLLNSISYLKTVCDNEVDHEFCNDGYESEKNKNHDLYISKFTKLPITNSNKSELDRLREVHKIFPEIIGTDIEEQIEHSLKELEDISSLKLNEIFPINSNDYKEKYFLKFKLPDELSSLYIKTNEVVASKGHSRCHDEDHGRDTNYLIAKLNAKKYFELAIELNIKQNFEFPIIKNTYVKKTHIIRDINIINEVAPPNKKLNNLIQKNADFKSSIGHLSDEVNFD